MLSRPCHEPSSSRRNLSGRIRIEYIVSKSRRGRDAAHIGQYRRAGQILQGLKYDRRFK
jgi:hypothetical protein